jgi:hypothetical protein
MRINSTFFVIVIGLLNVGWSACALTNTISEMIPFGGENGTAFPDDGSGTEVYKGSNDTELPDGIVGISLYEQGGEENYTSYYDGNNSIFHYYGNYSYMNSDGNETLVYVMYTPMTLMDGENGTFLPTDFGNYTIIEDHGSNNTLVYPIYYSQPSITTTGSTVVGKMMSGGGSMTMRGGGSMTMRVGGMGGGGGHGMGIQRNLKSMTKTRYGTLPRKRIRGSVM